MCVLETFSCILGVWLFSKKLHSTGIFWTHIHEWFRQRIELKTFLFGERSSLHWAMLFLATILDNNDKFVGSFYYITCKFDRANDQFNRTRGFETSHNCCHQEWFQMFITTPIGATSIHFVVKRDLQNFGSTCGSLRKSFWRHDIKNTQHHLKWPTPP